MKQEDLLEQIENSEHSESEIDELIFALENKGITAKARAKDYEKKQEEKKTASLQQISLMKGRYQKISLDYLKNQQDTISANISNLKNPRSQQILQYRLKVLEDHIALKQLLDSIPEEYILPVNCQ